MFCSLNHNLFSFQYLIYFIAFSLSFSLSTIFHPSSLLATLFRFPALHVLYRKISTRVMGQISGSQEPGKKQVKQRVRSRKEAADNGEHAEKQRREAGGKGVCPLGSLGPAEEEMESQNANEEDEDDF